MVALVAARQTGHQWPGWTVATAVAVMGGVAARLVIGDDGVGHRSAAVMMVLLGAGIWIGARVLSTPSTAFVATVVLVVLLDVAALPARNAPEYDQREAFYRTDQVLSARMPVPPDGPAVRSMLTLLAEPVFRGPQPTFGLGAEIGGASLVWDCAFERGIQRLALPLPTSIWADERDVRLHLTGSPSRDSDYLLVYGSSVHRGFLASVVDAESIDPNANVCAIA